MPRRRLQLFSGVGATVLRRMGPESDGAIGSGGFPSVVEEAGRVEGGEVEEIDDYVGVHKVYEEQVYY